MKKIYTIFVVAVLFLIIPSISLATTVTTFATFGASSEPTALVFDTAGNLYSANQLSGTISKVTPSGTVTTFATVSTYPNDLAIDTANNLYVVYGVSSGLSSNIINKITPSGTVSTFATVVGGPITLAFDTAGNLYTANWVYGGPYSRPIFGTISKITPSGTVTTFATVCSMPGNLVFDAAGNLYAACNNDYANTHANGTISKVTPSGTVSTFATLGAQGYGSPRLAFDTSGNLYVIDGGASLKKVTPSGTIINLTGSYSYASVRVFDTAGNLYVSNYGNDTIIKVTPSGVATTFAYLGSAACPQALAFDTAGNLYTANYCRGTISKISSSISVSSNVAASWTLTGPATITGSGTSQLTYGKPSGVYTITWGVVSGYTTPATQTLTLASMGDISFSGTYLPSPCTLPWGGSINSGSAVTAYQASSVACGSTCSSQTRICTRGTLSGTYANRSCSVANPSGYGNACTSTANACGQTTANGTIQCNSTCSSTPPANPAYYGSACTGATSAPNICGQTNPGGAGTYRCAGTNAQSNCSGAMGTTPSNSNCYYVLTVNKAGTGTGTVTGAGSYSYNTLVTATASASGGSYFAGWSGDCNSSGQVTMTSSKTCTATFTLTPIPGACSATHYNCSSGTSASNAESSPNWTWVCNGLYGGTNASCSQSIPPSTNLSSSCTGNGKSASISWSLPSGYTLSYFRITDSTTGLNLNSWIPENVSDTGSATSVATTPGHSYSWWVHTRLPSGAYSREVYGYFTCANPAPTAGLSASPNPASYNGSSTLTWSSTNATSCTAGGPWSNAGTLSGSGLTNPLTSNTTFTFQCTGPGGTTPVESVTVTVPAPINGTCSTTHYSCNTGTSVSNGGNAFVWAWACNGLNGGINDTTCSETKTYTVTPSVGSNGSISPSTPQTVNSGSTKTFTITPNAGYTASVGGTCGGTLVGNTYITNAVTGNCTVSVIPVINTFTVTPSAGAGGSISPSTPQTVNYGSTKVFTITPNSNYSIVPPIGGTCGGTLVGTTYTTSAITGNCTVSATFGINAPGAPTGFTATANSCGNTSLNLSWNASVNATNYKVYRNGTLVYDSSGLSFSDTGLTLGATYPYTITASNLGGTSNPAPTSGTVASACPIAGGWSGWGACTATACGCSGTQTRTCSNPYPANGGADCSGSATQACGTPACSSGTLSATSCVITKDASTCTSQVTWTTTNLTAGATEVTRNNPNGTHLSYNTSGTNVPSTVKYGASSFFLYHNINGIPTLLASTNINASCAPATIWNGSICKNASSMSGTLVPAVSFCNILEGQNSCNLNFSWNTLSPAGVSAVTSLGMANVNGNLGNQAFPVPYTASPRIFYLYNSAIELAKSTVTAKCASGTYWNNSQCVAVSACVVVPNSNCQDQLANNAGGPLPCTYSSGSGANINADSTMIVSGGSTILTWDGSGSCSGTNFSTGGASSGRITISPTSTTTYALTCGTSTDQVTVTVEKKPKFIEH